MAYSNWQLPDGVSPGTWDYTQKDSIATDYDEYFACHPLFELDESILHRYIVPEPESVHTVADFGCGTGRALVGLVRRGFHGLAIDLSQAMLEELQEKAKNESLQNVSLVRANLVELSCLKDNCIDHAVCLFSTIGMIQGRRHRRQALGHIRRLLRSGGRFVLHVHNVWAALYDTKGPQWLIESVMQSIGRSTEFGDRTYAYRGLPNMFLHNYRLGELKRDLAAADFDLLEIINLNRTASGSIRFPWLMPRLRAGGFIVICK